MSEHTVNVKTPALEVGKVDAVFTIRHDEQVHGRLKISRGGVEWTQRPDSMKASTCSGTSSTESSPPPPTVLQLSETQPGTPDHRRQAQTIAVGRRSTRSLAR
jgi:hypothetical protein